MSESPIEELLKEKITEIEKKSPQEKRIKNYKIKSIYNWQIKNPEKVKKYKLDYYERNKDEIRIKQNKYYKIRKGKK